MTSFKGNMNVSFGQNKIYVYADFDRTLSPATTKDIFYAQDKSKIESAKQNFDTINSLLDKYQDISLFITTGRSNCELKRMQELYERLGISFPKAKAIITKDGSEEFQSSGNSAFPFTQSNEQRNKIISDLANWNQEEIKKNTNAILKKYNLEPVQCETTLSAEKYGKYSAFSTPEIIHDNSVLIRNVGKMKLYLGFADSIPEETYQSVKDDLIKYFKQSNIKFDIKETSKDFECNKFRTLMFIPLVDSERLTKSYDIKERFMTADSSDVIIVAGDSLNDFEMLNPESYENPNNAQYIGVVIEKENEPEEELEALCNKHSSELTRIPEGTLSSYLSKVAIQKYGETV